MKDIIRSTFYSINKSGIFIKSLIIFLLISVTSIICGILQLDVVDAEGFAGVIDTLTMFNNLVIIFFSALSIGVELKNKTIFYLIMNGHSRINIFVGKTLSLFPYIFIMVLMQSLIMYLSFLILGIGDIFNSIMPFFILKSVIILVVYYSYAVFSVTFTFVARNVLGGIGFSFILMVFYNIIGFLLSEFSGSISGNFIGMFVFKNIYLDNLHLGYLLIVFFAYIIISIVYSLIGYYIFNKFDLT